MRIIILTGKGGAGVTAVAAATALATAGRGASTLALGLSPGLSAALGAAPAAEPSPVAPNLWALEAASARSDSPDAFLTWLRDLMAWRDIDEALADDLAALPGLRFIARLLELHQQAGSGRFEVIVVDAPQADHTVDLLASLDAAARWLGRLFSPRQPTVFEPFLRAISGYSSSGEDVYEGGRDLLQRLAALRELLTESETTSLRLVLSADNASLALAQRALSSFSLFAYPVDAAICNLILTADIKEPFFQGWLAQQQDALGRINNLLTPLPVLSLPLQSRTLTGVADLALLTQPLVAQIDPAAILYRGPVHTFFQEDSHDVLSLALPFARREELGVEHAGEHLVVHLGSRQRAIPLPPDLHSLDAVSTFDGQTLKITFGSA